MSLLKNNDPKAAVRSIEVLADGAGALVVIQLSPSQRKAVEEALAGTLTPVTAVTRDGVTSLVLQAPSANAEQIAQRLGGNFSEVIRKAPMSRSSLLDMNRMRGILGTFGQIMQQIAGYQEKNPVLSQSSGISLASNLITVTYGTPHRINHEKTERMRWQADLLLKHHLQNYQAPDEKDVQKPRYTGSQTEKINRFVGANNVYISDGMKFASQVFLGTRGNNWVDRTMGRLQYSAKLVTFSGIDRDKDTPDKEKSWITWFRENTNPFSGALEWAGQFMNLFNAVYLPQIHNVAFGDLKKEFATTGIKAVKKHYRPFSEMFSAANWKSFKFSEFRIVSPMRFVSVCLFLSGFGAKMIAPFSMKDVDWPELQHHAALALKNVPPEKLPHLLAEISALYVKAINDPNVSFGQVYQSLQTEIAGIEQPFVPPDNAKPITGTHTAALMAQRAGKSSAPEVSTSLQ